MSMSNEEIINKSGISTSSLSNGGLLNKYQARKFLQQTFDATPLGQLVRHEMRETTTGEIDKLGIASRILRKKTEGVDDGYRAGVTTSKLEYSCTAVRLPWELTNETLRQNIEGESFETTVANNMTRQLGVDTEDIYLNGDTSVSASDPDHDFLYINDGWVKQLLNGSHIKDATGDTFDLDLMYETVRTLPNKYNNGNLRWIMSPFRQQQWEQYLLNAVIGKGGGVPDRLYTSPASIPIVTCPKMSDDKIILTDPKNLIVVNSYNMKINKTEQGKEAIMQDKRFYVIHFDFDPIIEELDAAAIVTNLA